MKQVLLPTSTKNGEYLHPDKKVEILCWILFTGNRLEILRYFEILLNKYFLSLETFPRQVSESNGGQTANFNQVNTYAASKKT